MNPAVYFLSTVQKNHIPIPITIGTQIWDSINLNTAYYTDGTPIQFGMLSGQTVGGWYWYNNDQSKGLIYGRLYNRWAVEGVDGSGTPKTMAPAGWRISTPEDWTTLSEYLGGNTVAGGKLKQAGLSLWQANNTGATNSSGFTALPGGNFRRDTDTYTLINTNIYFRTTDYLTTPVLSYNSAALTYSTLTNNNHGFYVRLIKKVPTMTTGTGAVGSPTSSAIIINNSNISDANGYTITQRGVCWGTSANPIKVSGNFTSDGLGIGTFTSNITGLNPNITYYIRAYAMTSSETFYANHIIFTTTGTSSITTSAVAPKPVTAISGGTITSSNTNIITQSGICWAVYPATPTIALSTKTTDGETGIAPPDKNCGAGFMTGLTQNTQYNVRAYVTTTDTTYGNQVLFTTLIDNTSATTDSVTTITPISATVNYTINAGTYYPIITQGVCWSASTNPTIADSKTTITGGSGGTFSASLTGLGPSSTYYIRAYITNTSGTIYSTGSVTSFSTTSANIPLHVFSMRKYITTANGYVTPYTGYAITVRRGTGASIVTANVSFNSSGWVGLDSIITTVSGTTTSTTLGGFAGITGSIGLIDSGIVNQTIYVSKWYDQSGNAKDVVQASNTTSQPTIITTGVLNTINSRPYIKFASASNTYLSFTDSNTIPLNSLTSFSVISTSTSTNQNVYALNNADVNAFRYYNPFIVSTTDNIGYGSAFGTSFGANTLNVVKLYNLVTTSTGFSGWRNRTAIPANPTLRTNTGNIAYISIGRSGAATSNHLNGSIQEILCFSGAADRTTITDDIINTYNIV